MALKDNLNAEVTTIFKTAWTERKGTVVPDDASIKLNNDGVQLNATVLYADLADSTALVDKYKKPFAAEVYKAFLHCAAKILRSEGGIITAYDGDRIMAVFIGDTKNSTAVRAAMKINWCRQFLVQPVMKKQYPSIEFVLHHVCGIDTSELLVAKTGIRGSNDLVWVGRAANYAAKLAALDHAYPTWITKFVYDSLADQSKYAKGVNMWEERSWTAMGGKAIYRSNYHWAL